MGSFLEKPSTDKSKNVTCVAKVIVTSKLVYQTKHYVKKKFCWPKFFDSFNTS
jgi:hypothetical protein